MKAVRVFLCVLLWNRISSQQIYIFQHFCGFEDFYASFEYVFTCMSVKKKKRLEKWGLLYNIHRPLVEMIAAN